MGAEQLQASPKRGADHQRIMPAQRLSSAHAAQSNHLSQVDQNKQGDTTLGNQGARNLGIRSSRIDGSITRGRFASNGRETSGLSSRAKRQPGLGERMAWQSPAAGPDNDKGPIENNETVRSLEQTNQETTTERVIVIHQLLNDLYKQFGQPLPYLEFVIHAQSFGKTCENIFHLALLIEGHACIKNDESNLLAVEPVFKNTSAQCEANENVFIMTLDFKKWQGAVEALKITKPVIPN